MAYTRITNNFKRLSGEYNKAGYWDYIAALIALHGVGKILNIYINLRSTFLALVTDAPFNSVHYILLSM